MLFSVSRPSTQYCWCSESLLVLLWLNFHHPLLRRASSCVRESRCDGVNPLCPASNLRNRHPCPWHRSNNRRKRGYRIYSMKNNTGQAQTAHAREWRECEGVCYDGVCALRWDSPSMIRTQSCMQQMCPRPMSVATTVIPAMSGRQETCTAASDVSKSVGCFGAFPVCVRWGGGMFACASCDFGGRGIHTCMHGVLLQHQGDTSAVVLRCFAHGLSCGLCYITTRYINYVLWIRMS